MCIIYRYAYTYIYIYVYTTASSYITKKGDEWGT